MKPETIHETVIRDIIDLIHDTKKAADSDLLYGSNTSSRSYRSIASASSGLTLVFPVLVSRNINIENASMIAKALERRYVTMLQMLFTALNITDSDNGVDYIRQFHTNLKIDDNITIDSFMRAMDQIARIEYESTSMHTLKYKKLEDSIKKDMKHINYTLPDSINEMSLCDFYYKESGNFGRGTVINEAKGKKGGGYQKHKGITFSPTTNVPVYIDNKSKGGGGGSRPKDRFDMVKNQVMDTDVKKANELVPTMMIVNYISADPLSGMEPIESNMAIGVKAKLYPLDSQDILNRIIVKNQDKNGFLKLIRATTREISFCRDFLFAIDKAKIDALSHSRRGSSSKLWKVLERRAVKSKLKRLLRLTNDASAITTLVVSAEEAELLKKYENIDIMNPRVIRPIMEAYNLIGVCVIDESIEVAHFIFDTGNDIYESVPFTHLEREGNDNSYKKIINLMGKVAR